ncbi:hypothetical protein [Tenacibaculum soleae]|uniref:hypothetical protein n=1 Tax=Tenacibaculum soleae TaxID=447689 RepID=UPI003AB29199
MNRIVFKSVIVCFLLFTGIINSQTKRVKENKVKIDKELIQEAFFLLNNNEEEKAYTIAKKLKKTTKSRYALMNSNMVLAYYFNRKVTIDSSIFYAR